MKCVLICAFNVWWLWWGMYTELQGLHRAMWGPVTVSFAGVM